MKYIKMLMHKFSGKNCFERTGKSKGIFEVNIKWLMCLLSNDIKQLI